ncbi:hypothetical protein HYX14_03090 [Candidatus Woesearchaeota archaeon]|nr:hypothetical protein [Candidatus Woesearchaeota archaeon]
MRRLSLLSVALLLLSPGVLAHCPLCTIGAAAAAGGAVWLGISMTVVSIFIGAFAVSTGWWVSRLIKREFIPGQKAALIILSFLLTIVPMISLPLFKEFTPISVFWFGDYGSWFNRTYLANKFLLGSLLGGVVVCSTPWLSNKITQLRNGKMLPYQGLTLTFALLIVISIVIELARWIN